MQNTQSLDCKEANVSPERQCHALWVMWSSHRYRQWGKGRISASEEGGTMGGPLAQVAST